VTALLSICTLAWQLFVLFTCCFGFGFALRFLFPKEFSLVNKVLFSLLGGLFLVVLIPQNLVYLGVPVRISAWLILGAALVHGWLCRHKFIDGSRRFYSNAEIRTLAVLIFLTIIFHGAVPILQGLDRYYGKGYGDQLNYVLLAEFLKEEPYSTNQQDIGLRPWLLGPVGFHVNYGTSPGPGRELVALKTERIGQSIITSEMSTWSGTNGKGGYAATVIFFLAALTICLYVFLRELGIDRFMAGSGALLGGFLPIVTRLSLEGFLSQISILFAFPFIVSLLRHKDLSPQSFVLFFSLALAYVVAAYSEIAPIGFCTLFLGVIFVRRDKMRPKRLMLMSAILLIALMNPYYLRNLIKFLGQQYYIATNSSFLENLAPNVLSLHGWSELIFGTATSAPFAWFFDYCAILLGLLFLAGAILLSRRDRLILSVILLPGVLFILFLASRGPASYYPIAKITATILPFVIGLVFIGPSRVAFGRLVNPIAVLVKLLSTFIVVAAAAGSVRYYSEVLNNEGLLRYVREPHFLKVCSDLERISRKRVLVFETNPLLATWLCYHARHNDAYIDCRFMNDLALTKLFLFAKVPDFKNVDFVVTRDRIVDLRSTDAFCLTLVEDTPGEDRTDGQVHYWLGPPVGFRFLALRAMSANLNLRLAPGPEAATLPIDFFLTDEQGHVSRGEIKGETVEVRRMNFPPGPSSMQLSVKAKESGSKTAGSFPILAELDGVEISDIDFNPR
jgi:hypothetical protein